MPQQDPQLGRRQEAAVAALLSSRTNEEAAREAGVTSRTLRRWMKRQDFRARLHEVRCESFARDYARLQQGSGAAVSTLLKTLVAPKTTEALRVSIAKFVLDSTQKSLEIQSINLRVSDLEMALADASNRSGETYEDLNVTPEPDQTH